MTTNITNQSASFDEKKFLSLFDRWHCDRTARVCQFNLATTASSSWVDSSQVFAGQTLTGRNGVLKQTGDRSANYQILIRNFVFWAVISVPESALIWSWRGRWVVGNFLPTWGTIKNPLFFLMKSVWAYCQLLRQTIWMTSWLLKIIFWVLREILLTVVFWSHPILEHFWLCRLNHFYWEYFSLLTAGPPALDQKCRNVRLWFPLVLSD